jgi:uncharacterized repeat protein (TIGR01451 family)
MKRILARVMALATVAALGWIAIAQAQRSVEAPVSAAIPPQHVAAPTESADSDSASPGPEVSGADRRAPGLFPDGGDIRPLRTESDDGILSGVITTSAEEEVYPITIASAEAETSHEAGPALDPFAGRSPAHAAKEAAVSVPGPSGSASEPAPDRMPARVAGQPAPSSIGPSEADASQRVEATPSAVGSRYRDRVRRDGADDPVETREPAQFLPDPSAPATSIHANPSADRYAAPGRESYAGAVGPLDEGTGKPGNHQLEGPQTPQLTIQKSAPAEIQVGKEAVFRVKVVNSGKTVAQGVEIHDEIPRGCRLVATKPSASRGSRGELIWELGTIQPGGEATVEATLMPVDEGEIGSVATVHLQADASVRTVATKPELAVRTSAPDRVMIGEEVKLTISVSNPGSGIASAVVLENHVPDGLEHPAGRELEYAVGDLAPGETRELELTLVASKAGRVHNVLTARADANLAMEDRVDVEIVAPRLDLALEGPKRRYLEREATYTLSVSNPGTAPARHVELVAHLPEGLEFVSANNAGEYQSASRSVRWLLEELPVDETGSVRLTTMPIEAGEKRLRFAGTAEPGLSVEGEQPILVEGIAAILFQVVDIEDPIELGGETTYEIRVVNQGSKAATNVEVMALLPPEMQPLAAEGPVRHTIESNRVIFEGLPRLAPKADTTYRVRVQGLRPGDLRLRVQLRTNEIDDWVLKEESTRVYSDE